MAIKNASDLLVYRVYPAAVNQVTRIRVLKASPLSGNGNLKILNTTTSAGANVAELTTAISGNTGAAVFGVLTNTLVANGYSVPVSAVDDGDYLYKDCTNSFAGDVNTLSIADGTADIDEGAIEVIVLTEGEDAGADAVAHSTSASISFNNDLRDVTTKDSAGFQENAGGLRSFELSTDALQDISADQDFYDFFSDISQRNEVSVRFAERATGASTDVKWEGSGYVSSLSMDAGVEENVTYSVTITGTGVVTKGTY